MFIFNLPTISYHRVSLSPSCACTSATRKPTRSLSVTLTGDSGFTCGTWSDWLGTATTFTDTLQMLDLGGVPPSVARIYEWYKRVLLSFKRNIPSIYLHITHTVAQVQIPSARIWLQWCYGSWIWPYGQFWCYRWSLHCYRHPYRMQEPADYNIIPIATEITYNNSTASNYMGYVPSLFVKMFKIIQIKSYTLNYIENEGNLCK